jgi:lysophospholipase L1-like esterase
MHRDPGGAARIFTRDIGGMPLWSLILVLVVACGGAFTISSGASAAGPAPTFTPPTSAPSPTIPQPKPLAVFLGDSYTQGTGGDGVRWPDIVGDERGWDVANLALGGTGYITTSDANGCGRPYCGTYLEASAEIVGSPRYIFVAGGRNDLGRAPSDVLAAADALFAQLRDRYPDAQIFVVNPWFDDDAAPPALGNLAVAIGESAAKNGVTVLDTEQPLRGREDLISADGVHPNANGYRDLAARVQAALLAALGA